MLESCFVIQNNAVINSVLIYQSISQFIKQTLNSFITMHIKKRLDDSNYLIRNINLKTSKGARHINSNIVYKKIVCYTLKTA